MSDNSVFSFFATTPKGLELLLVAELEKLGAIKPAEKLAGVTFQATLETAYRACLWSRLANRILLPLAQIPAASPEELYQGIQTIQWSLHMIPSATLGIHFVSSHSNITHTLYGAQKVKDAIVDQLRSQFNERPTITSVQPNISVHVYLYKNVATVSLDFAGESLHRRGYRLEQVQAPLKENLAAALLIRAGWDKPTDKMLFDPMCGSGTLLIEGALIAGNIAPGLYRDYFGFLSWKKHDSKIWCQLREEAEQIRAANLTQLPPIVGYDHDPSAIKIAFANIERAGLRGKIHVEKRSLSASIPKLKEGLLITNPPYGERLGEITELKQLYLELGQLLKKDYIGWRAGVFTSNPDLGKSMQLRSCKQYAFYNGAIPSQLLLFDVQPSFFVDTSPENKNARRILIAKRSLNSEDRQQADMFANRLRKNFKKYKKWADQNSITSYRIYDADIPEYAVTIDVYENYICVQEYPAPKSVPIEKIKIRLQHIFAVIDEVLPVIPANIFLRDPKNQIEDLDAMSKVTENNLNFLINLIDPHHEVGLPLEQRLLRQEIEAQVSNKTFLNVMSRSSSISCFAAKAGAKSITAICENPFYFEWSKQNLDNNHFEAEVLSPPSLFESVNKVSSFDIIFFELPPYTFKNKELYLNLLDKLIPKLTPGGWLYLLTKDGRFKLDETAYPSVSIQNISSRILSFDFERSPKIQQCWKMVAL